MIDMRSTKHHIDYSIVICAYNPDKRILQRCLDAVFNLRTENLAIEVILVDNNSTAPLKTLDWVSSYLEKIPGMQILTVLQQGVKYARMAAIEMAKGGHIVYIDYDNEPENDYLLELKILNTQYPQVAAWGPGIVTVDFIDGVEPTLYEYAKVAFQERKNDQVAFSDDHDWQPHYPFGTGLCIDSTLLKEYVQLAKAGRFNLLGRNGDQLSSGEDTQMVLLCISKGFNAGVSPGLKLKHIIPGERANFNYLKRLAYGTSLCYYTCKLQVFPQYREQMNKDIIPVSRFVRHSLKKWFKLKQNPNNEQTFEFINYLGLNAGMFYALGKPLPVLIKLIVKYMKLV
jgi:glycosyltransferase involved in cell wall biosynthesis